MKLNGYFNSKLTREAAGEGSPAAPDPTAQNPAAPAEPAAAAAPTAPDLSWAGDAYFSDGQFQADAFRDHYQGLLAEKTRRDEVAANIPEDGRYSFDLPEGVELPEGVQIAFATDDPDYAGVTEKFRAFLHENGIPQTQATGMMGILAEYEGARMQKQVAAANAAYESLGPSDAARDARLATIKRALETRISADEVSAVMSALPANAAAVKALEKLLAGNLGATSPRPNPQQSALPPNARPIDRLIAANAQAQRT